MVHGLRADSGTTCAPSQLPAVGASTALAWRARQRGGRAVQGMPVSRVQPTRSTAAAEPHPDAPRGAVNYHHWGEPKRWYGVPAGAAAAFEAAFREELPEQFERHPDLLFHLVAMLSPAALRRRGVPVYGVLQARPGRHAVARRAAPRRRARLRRAAGARRAPACTARRAAVPRRRGPPGGSPALRPRAASGCTLSRVRCCGFAARAARVRWRPRCARLQKLCQNPVSAPALCLGAARPRRGHARGRRAPAQDSGPARRRRRASFVVTRRRIATFVVTRRRRASLLW